MIHFYNAIFDTVIQFIVLLQAEGSYLHESMGSTLIVSELKRSLPLPFIKSMNNTVVSKILAIIFRVEKLTICSLLKYAELGNTSHSIRCLMISQRPEIRIKLSKFNKYLVPLK